MFHCFHYHCGHSLLIVDFSRFLCVCLPHATTLITQTRAAQVLVPRGDCCSASTASSSSSASTASALASASVSALSSSSLRSGDGGGGDEVDFAAAAALAIDDSQAARRFLDAGAASSSAAAQQVRCPMAVDNGHQTIANRCSNHFGSRVSDDSCNVVQEWCGA